jgi:hypothetical protein
MLYAFVFTALSDAEAITLRLEMLYLVIVAQTFASMPPSLRQAMSCSGSIQRPLRVLLPRGGKS